MSPSPLADSMLVAEVKQLIQSARQRAVAAVNAELTLLYWQVGKRLADEVLGGERAEYGKQVIAGLTQQLTLDYGKGWSKGILNTLFEEHRNDAYMLDNSWA